MAQEPGGTTEEALEYRRVLAEEVAAHRRFSRITLLTGVSLMIGGFAAVSVYSSLGWLLVIVGMLRVLNSLFDLQREDILRRKLRLLEGRFERTGQS